VGQIATIAVDDASATSHNFVPHSRENGITRFEEKSSSSALGFMPLGVSLRENGNGDVDRFTLKFEMPVVQTETINGVDYPKVVRTLMAKVEYTLPTGSTLAERQDLNAFVRNLLASTDIKDVCENLNGMY
jgi:hypothetical protein